MVLLLGVLHLLIGAALLGLGARGRASLHLVLNNCCDVLRLILDLVYDVMLLLAMHLRRGEIVK